LLWYVRHQEIGQAETNVTAHAAYTVQAILRDELRRSDIEHPVSGSRLRQLDWLFTKRVMAQGGLRVKVYRMPDGVVTYSNRHELIGTHSDEIDELHEVAGGEILRDVKHLNTDGGTGANPKALEVYVPLALRGDSKPTAVFEVYESYAPVDKAVRSFLKPFVFLLVGALIALWVALFPLIQRMVRARERDRDARHSAERALEETSEQLRQAQKMEAIGQLAGGVAHDFNNLLLAINGYADFLVTDVDDERQRTFATEIRNAGERAAELTHQLLAFSRRQVLQPRVVDLNESIQEIETMMQRLLGAGVRVVLDLDPKLRAVEADPSQIGQVLLNLAVNARDAMDGKGTLRIATRNDGQDVVLQVADTGVGMDAGMQARIFEPFFTTKDVGDGTGLGLSTVYGIVTQSGGTIDVRSAPGLGSTFSVRLPATDRTPEAATDVQSGPAAGGERILVVDDERVVRDLIARMLSAQGYAVDVAGSAREARALTGPWDLLVTDVVMPELDGVKLSRQIDAVQVLFISGYDQEALVESDASFLQKPFNRDDLTHTVRTMLDSAKRARRSAAA